MQETKTKPIPDVSIPLPDYLLLACKGFEQIAVVDVQWGGYIQSLDKCEDYTHVEFNVNPPENNLAYIYPISEWRSCQHRRAKQQERAEVTRKLRYAVESEMLANKEKIQRRRDILAETVKDVSLLFPIRPQGFDDKLLEYMVFQALRGENATIATKFNISLDLIKEFSSLPSDPDWSNKYYKKI